MRQPSALAGRLEDNPRLPAGAGERVAGYGVMGLPFRDGHVLGLRRWTASSVAPGFTSVWYRDPTGRWTFYESAPIACTRYFGSGAERVRVEPIELAWLSPRTLRVRTTRPAGVDWTVQVGSTPVTRLMSLVGSALPTTVWRSRPLLVGMGRVAGWALRAGTVRLTGATSNGQQFEATPRRTWVVTDSRATVEGVDLGPVGPVPDQAHLADFYLPQRGIFAIGGVFMETPPASTKAGAA